MKTKLNELLVEVGQSYEKSDIRQYCLKNGHAWHYSLITTTMEYGGPLILGFNWGASQGEIYSPQHYVEKGFFSKSDIGSLSRITPYCEKYFGGDFLTRASQSNYCFFRSQTESQISPTDIGLCEPIFERLINTIQPSSILCFSSKLRDYLLNNGRVCSSESSLISFKRGSADVRYEAIRATLITGTKIKFLPHPNYPMTKDARTKAWEFCCGHG